MAITLDGSNGIKSSNRIDTEYGFRQLNGTTQIAGIFPERVITGAGTSDDLCIFTETGYDLHVMTGGSVDKKLSVDSAGRVTMPYQPAFSASYSDTTPVSSVGAVYIWNNVRLNQGNAYNPSTGIFTAPVAGNYKIDVSILSNSGSYVGLEIRKNNVRWYSAEDTSSTSNFSQVSATAIFPMAAGDTLSVNHKNGTMYGGGGHYNMCNIQLIG